MSESVTQADRDAVANYLFDLYDDDDDDDFDPEGPAFECAGYNDGTRFYCPLWGSEECDWECPEGGLG